MPFIPTVTRAKSPACWQLRLISLPLATWHWAISWKAVGNTLKVDSLLLRRPSVLDRLHKDFQCLSQLLQIPGGDNISALPVSCEHFLHNLKAILATGFENQLRRLRNSARTTCTDLLAGALVLSWSLPTRRLSAFAYWDHMSFSVPKHPTQYANARNVYKAGPPVAIVFGIGLASTDVLQRHPFLELGSLCVSDDFSQDCQLLASFAYHGCMDASHQHL